MATTAMIECTMVGPGAEAWGGAWHARVIAVDPSRADLAERARKYTSASVMECTDGVSAGDRLGPVVMRATESVDGGKVYVYSPETAEEAAARESLATSYYQRRDELGLSGQDEQRERAAAARADAVIARALGMSR